MAVKATAQKEEGKEKRFIPEEGGAFYFVSPDGDVIMKAFRSNGECLALVCMGNSFESVPEAEKHIDEIVAKYKEVIA